MPIDEVGGRRRGGALAAALIALACALALAPIARAEEFVVNSTADKTAATPGVDCALSEGHPVGECTLRAAIEAGEGFEEFFSIEFDEEAFDGQASGTIMLNSSLPPITYPALIEGTCQREGGDLGPCVGVDGPGGEPALVLSNVEESEVWGLAMTGAKVAVSLEGSPRTKIRGDWFGVALDGTSSGNETGVIVGPGSNRSFVGGEGPGQGDVFAGNTADGLDVRGGNGVKVYGNWFGVKPDGVTPSPNGGDDIEVASNEGLEFAGTEIGTRVSPAAAASPRCDGGCNVISGAGSNGIDLEGDGLPESHVASTSILSNYIGLDANGTAVVPNTGAGVNVGEAAHTIVGGPSAGEPNRINGGSVGVLAGPAAGDLAVRGNLIGVDAAGTGALGPPDDGIVVDSAELATPALEAEIADNEIRMGGGVAIAQQGQGAWIFGNRIFGPQVGIKTFGVSEYGNVIEGNLIDGASANGVLVENNLNEVIGNEVGGSGAAGIWIKGGSPEATRNRVGGDMAAEENVVDGSVGAAIEISDEEETDNEVARNRGSGNGGRFIELIAASPEEDGPNRGIKPPTISTSTQPVAGGGAEPGATVRVFRKLLAAPGELDSFLGEAVADDDGGWKVSFESPLPTGSIVAATQTVEGATSELATAVTGGEEETEGLGAGDGGGGGVFGAGAQPLLGSTAQIRPQTRIVRSKPQKRGVRFVFDSNRASSTFLCRLDHRPFDICKSPKRYTGLEPGRHVFWVRAVDPAGHVDLSPAKKKFTISG